VFDENGNKQFKIHGSWLTEINVTNIETGFDTIVFKYILVED